MVWMASRRGGRCQGPAGPNRASPNRASETHGKPGQAPAVQRGRPAGRLRYMGPLLSSHLTGVICYIKWALCPSHLNS